MPPAAPLVPLLFPGVKGEAISRSARGARAGLSAAIPKVGGGNATPAVQEKDVQEERGEVAVLGGNGACGAEEGRSTSNSGQEETSGALLHIRLLLHFVQREIRMRLHYL